MYDFKIGDTVQYSFYGKVEQSKIIRLSNDSTILFLEDGKWIHSISATILIKG